MSQKADDLRTRFGSTLADSVGLRAGESVVPMALPDDAATPRPDFTRDRSVGDIEIEHVIPDPEQVRKEFDEEEMQQLSDDIKDRGQLMPARVRWSEAHKKWMLISGERRYRAIKRAGLKTIKCVFIHRELSDTEIKSEQIVENVLRSNLNAMEEARGYQALMELNGWSATELAANLHVSKGKVSKALSLLKLPEDVQSKVESGEIAATTAYQVAKVKNPQEQQALAEKAAAGHVRSSEAEKASRKPASGARKRRSTNETFRTTTQMTIHITGRKDVGLQGVLDALLEAMEHVRQQLKASTKEAA